MQYQELNNIDDEQKQRLNEQTFMGHPKGLFVLFIMEMWERFSYYGMRSILVLFLTAQINFPQNPGLGWEQGDALALYGWYTMAVYLTAYPGGIIADQPQYGQKKAVLVGGSFMFVGHTMLVFSSTFKMGLFLITIGVGLLKPNISTLVGKLYSLDDPMRDQGFTIFYMGINIGAFLSSIVVGYIGEKIDWHYGFGLAAIGMFLAMVVFLYGQGYIVEIQNQKNDIDEIQQDLQQPLSDIEQDRYTLIKIIFALTIFFWGAFEQAGGLMSIFTKNKIDRHLFGFEIPASWFQSLNALFIILFGIKVDLFWQNRRQEGNQSDPLYKIGWGLIIMGSGFIFMVLGSKQYDIYGKSSMFWLVLAYLFHTIGELCFSPVVLSYITKLAPKRYASRMMGLYFAITGLGNKLAGILGESSTEIGDQTVFTLIFLVCILAGSIMIYYQKSLQKLSHLEQEYNSLANQQTINKYQLNDLTQQNFKQI